MGEWGKQTAEGLLAQGEEWARRNRHPIVCTENSDELVNDPSKFIKILDALQQPTVVISMFGDEHLPGLEHPIDSYKPNRSVTPSPPNARWQKVLQHKMLRAFIPMNAIAATNTTAGAKLWAVRGVLAKRKEGIEMKNSVLLCG
jgi:hypothetical protein